MWVTVGNIATRVDRASREELEWLRDFLAFEDAKARYTRAFRTGQWDGRVRMFNDRAATFHTGFLPTVKRAALARNFTVEVNDQRPRPPPVRALSDTLRERLAERDFQLSALEAMLLHGRGIVRVPTGGGKTEIAVAFAWSANTRTIFFVPNLSLLEQSAERYERLTGLKAGRVGGGERVNCDADFVVCTFQTAYRNLGDTAMRAYLESFGAVIFDEVHLLPANTFRVAGAAARGAYYRIGMSATPLDRKDGKSVHVIGACGPVIYEIATQTLIDADILVHPRVRFVTVAADALGSKDWREVYRLGVTESAEHLTQIVATAQAAAKPGFVFVKEIRHGKRITEALVGAGLRAKFVWGTHDAHARAEALRLLEIGKYEFLVSNVFDIGVDVPTLRSAVNAAGGDSIIKALQRLGRGMRVADGKTEFEFWDFDVQAHAWLRRHTRARVAAYVAQGFEVVKMQRLASVASDASRDEKNQRPLPTGP